MLYLWRMYRTKTVYSLLFIWLLAIMAPPVISLANEEERVFISLNQNEEEQSEQGKKDTSEEKIVQESDSFSAFNVYRNMKNYASATSLKMSACFLEIPLPPPEHNS